MNITNNVLVNAHPLYIAGGDGYEVYSNVVFRGNTLYGSYPNYAGPEVVWLATNGVWTFDYNSYYATPPNGVSFMEQYVYNKTFSQWKTDTGFDAHSTARDSTVPPDGVYVIPNQDQAKRCHIAVYNFSLANNVSANLSGVLNQGDTYQLLSAENYLAGPIQTGTYNGTSISIPMANLTAAPMLYGTNTTPAGDVLRGGWPTGPEFGAFVLIGAGPGRPAAPTHLGGAPLSP